MKFLAIALAASICLIPQRCKAPLTTIEVGVTVCVVSVVVVGGSILMIRSCEPKYKLVWEALDGEPRHYFCTKASMHTIAANEWHFCQGPFSVIATCNERAAVANTNAWAVNCGPMASSPAKRVTLLSTTNNGASWFSAASVVQDEGENYGFAVMPTYSATNGLPEVLLSEISECVPVVSGGASAFYRICISEP